MSVAGSRGDSRARQLAFVRFLADLLDQRFTIPGTSIRIGLDPIITLIPGIGDLVANIAGSAILLVAAQLGVPKIVLIRMGLNVAVNALIGAIPFLGDILSIWFRSNVKNVQLLERHLDATRRRATQGDWVFVLSFLVILLVLIVGIVVAILWALRLIWDRF
ncbi:MAG TPA: DUF4112 domain-containing protein [Candidatus Binatia bacterium]|jgi:hypothetical protein